MYAVTFAASEGKYNRHATKQSQYTSYIVGIGFFFLDTKTGSGRNEAKTNECDAFDNTARTAMASKQASKTGTLPEPYVCRG